MLIYLNLFTISWWPQKSSKTGTNLNASAFELIANGKVTKMGNNDVILFKGV